MLCAKSGNIVANKLHDCQKVFEKNVTFIERKVSDYLCGTIFIQQTKYFIGVLNSFGFIMDQLSTRTMKKV